MYIEILYIFHNRDLDDIEDILMAFKAMIPPPIKQSLEETEPASECSDVISKYLYVN